MLTRPYDRPKPEPTAQEEPEPTKCIEVEVTDIDIQFPDQMVALTLYPSKGDSFKYSIVGGDPVLRVVKGNTEGNYNLKRSFYHAFRTRIIKVPETKYVPPSAEPSE